MGLRDYDDALGYNWLFSFVRRGATPPIFGPLHEKPAKRISCCAKISELLIIFFVSSVLNGVLASDQIVITADRLNVRDGVWGKKLGKVFEGQQFEVRQKKEEWGKIEYELGKFGWISLDYARTALQTTSKNNVSLSQFC